MSAQKQGCCLADRDGKRDKHADAPHSSASCWVHPALSRLPPHKGLRVCVTKPFKTDNECATHSLHVISQMLKPKHFQFRNGYQKAELICFKLRSGPVLLALIHFDGLRKLC